MRIFSIILVLVLFAGYLAYGWVVNLTVEKNQKTCMETAAKHEIFRGDTTQLCQCSVEYIRENPFFNKEDPKFRTEYMNQLMSCGKKHVKQYGTEQCDTLKKDIRSKSGQNLDCHCFNQKLMNMVIKQLNGISPNRKLGKMEALNMMSGCLK